MDWKIWQPPAFRKPHARLGDNHIPFRPGERLRQFRHTKQNIRAVPTGRRQRTRRSWLQQFLQPINQAGKMRPRRSALQPLTRSFKSFH